MNSQFLPFHLFSTNSTEMETANEDTKSLLSHAHMSPSSIEDQQKSILISMARERSILQVVVAVATTDSIYHLLYILGLFFSSSIVHARLDLRPRRASLHAVYTNIEGVLRVELTVFAAVFLVRQVFDAYNAVQVQHRWVRTEERSQDRVRAFILLFINIIATTLFIFWPMLISNDGGKRRLCTSTHPANTSLDTPDTTRFALQGDLY